MKTSKFIYIWFCVQTICVMVVGCSQSNQSNPRDGVLEGKITVSGAWALYPMMVRWAEEFQKIHTEVRFDISAGGAGKGMADALAKTVDIGMISRSIHPQEVEAGAFWISVAKDAVFITVNENNPVLSDLRKMGITREKLIDIYITGHLKTWGEVIGNPSVVDPIHIYTRSDACGAAETWALFLDGRQEDLLGIGIYGDPGLLDAVIKDPLGIGFNNLNYVFDFDTGAPVLGAQVLSIDVDNNGIVEPQEEYQTKELAIQAVAKDYYPSPPARDLNLVTKGKPTGLVQIFILWILTEGQQYLDEAGYIPLTEGKLAEQMGKLD